MPYDPRPVSQGGNKGIDETFSRKARKGFHRVVLVDTFDGSDCKLGDRKSREDAVKLAQAHEGTMSKAYVYDDKGKCVYEGGKF